MGIRDWFRNSKSPPPPGGEVSKGGSRMLRYSGESFGKSRVGFTDESTLELIKQREKVYGELFGPCDNVLHEMIPFVPHIDVYRHTPSKRRDFYTFVTGGMSDLPMTAPEELGTDCHRVELVFYAADDRPIYGELLRRMAHFPHDNATWLHWGHTMPNGQPPAPIFDDGPLDSLFFMPSIVRPDSELGKRLLWQGEPINLVWCVPITTAECNLKLERGADALYDVVERNKHPFIFRGNRESYV
jgi:hypothetical protein